MEKAPEMARPWRSFRPPLMAVRYPMVRFCCFLGCIDLVEVDLGYVCLENACCHSAPGNPGGSARPRTRGLPASSSSNTSRARELFPYERGCSGCGWSSRCRRLRSWGTSWRRGGLRRLGCTGGPGRMAAAATGQHRLPPAHLQPQFVIFTLYSFSSYYINWNIFGVSTIFWVSIVLSVRSNTGTWPN